MEGPRPYDLQGLPADIMLGGEGGFPPLSPITLDDISCNVYGCGGESLAAAHNVVNKLTDTARYYRANHSNKLPQLLYRA
jgi:hypothetical protein